jgi:hypothetical protein
MNTIRIVPTASGYHGEIAGQNYGLKTPQDFQTAASALFPHLLFKVEIV